MVMGATGVGKSALTIRLVTGNFLDEYDPTIEDSYRKQMMIGGKPELLDILDTANLEEYGFANFFDSGMRGYHLARCFMLVYDVQSLESFEELKIGYKGLKRGREEEGMNVVLVGNKSDLYHHTSIGAQANMKLTPENIQDLVYGFMRC